MKNRGLLIVLAVIGAAMLFLALQPSLEMPTITASAPQTSSPGFVDELAELLKKGGSIFVGDSKSVADSTPAAESKDRLSYPKTGSADCSFDGKVVKHNATVTAYRLPTVPASATCEIEVRTCWNGTLSGAWPYASCTVAAAKAPSTSSPQSCVSDGETIPHLKTVIRYKVDRVDVAGGCDTAPTERRTCNDGKLSGTYQYRYCHSPESVTAPTNPSATSTTRPWAIILDGWPHFAVNRRTGVQFYIWFRPSGQYYVRSHSTPGNGADATYRLTETGLCINHRGETCFTFQRQTDGWQMSSASNPPVYYFIYDYPPPGVTLPADPHPI